MEACRSSVIDIGLGKIVNFGFLQLFPGIPLPFVRVCNRIRQVSSFHYVWFIGDNPDFNECKTFHDNRTGPTEIRTRIAGFKVQSANHYTIGPYDIMDKACL